MIDEICNRLRDRSVDPATAREICASGQVIKDRAVVLASELQRDHIRLRSLAASATRRIAAEVVASATEERVSSLYAQLRRAAAEHSFAELIPWGALNDVIAAGYGEAGLERIKLAASQEVKRRPAKIRPATGAEVTSAMIRAAAERNRKRKPVAQVGRPAAAVSKGRPHYASRRGKSGR